MNWAGAIVPLAVIAVLAVVILVIFLYVRGRLRNFSQQAFGTSDLSQAVKQIENASESARSIHGMTDIYLPQIHHDFPDFDYDVFKGRVEGVLRGYFAAITSRDVSQLTKDCSASLRNSVSGMIADLNANGYVREIRDTEIHQIEIARYIKNGATVTILFNASVGHYDVTRDENGKLIAGKTDRKKQTVYDVALVYVQDVAKMTDYSASAIGINCPNCGAPVRNLGQKFCDYCGTGIREINVRSWSFESVKEERTVAKPY